MWQIPPLEEYVGLRIHIILEYVYYNVYIILKVEPGDGYYLTALGGFSTSTTCKGKAQPSCVISIVYAFCVVCSVCILTCIWLVVRPFFYSLVSVRLLFSPFFFFSFFFAVYLLCHVLENISLSSFCHRLQSGNGRLEESFSN